MCKGNSRKICGTQIMFLTVRIVWIIAEESVVGYLWVSYFCVVFAVIEKVKLWMLSEEDNKFFSNIVREDICPNYYEDINTHKYLSFSFFSHVIKAAVAVAP